MDSVARGQSILRTAETALREATRQAAEAGDYDATVTLARWAQQLARMSGSAEGQSAETASPPTAISLVPRAVTGEIVTPGNSRPKRQLQQKPTKRESYPRFFKKGNLLIKVGWSKREKAEYKHKAPRSVVDSVVEALRGVARGQGPITIPDLLPLKSSSGEELPSYQVYLCLAWLRKLSLIDQHGREGYTVREPRTLAGDASLAWDALEKLHGS
jgi:hypothetical protein